MSIRSFFKPRALYLAALLIVILAFSAGAVYAAFVVIDTTDDSVTDWDSAGVEVFVSDLPGDHVPTIGATFDIINTWVARGEERMYFRLQTSAAPAIWDTRTPDTSANLAAVYLDCNNDGVDNSGQDRIIAYVSDQASSEACLPDRVLMVNPLSPMSGFVLVGQGDPDLAMSFGQRPANATDNIEWSIPMSFLENPSPWTGAVACNGQVGVRFAAMHMFECTPANMALQDDTIARVFNIPTSVELISFVDGRSQASPWFLGGMAALALLLAGLALAGRRYNGFRA